MSSRALKISAVVLLIASAAAEAGEYNVYTDSPRLFLRARRLRLLKRERQRDSMRWRQFQALIAGGAQLPQAGFAESLYAAVSDDREAAVRAASDARKSDDARQIALTLDWLRDSLAPGDVEALQTRLRQELAKPVSATDIAAVRTRVLAAIALSDSDPALSEKTLRWVVQEWWQSKIAPGLRAGAALVRPDEVFALYELLHAIRDNLTIDLRESAAEWFKGLPGRRLLSYYPAPYRGAENELRIPAFPGAGQPNIERAAMSRVAELEMVAYDPNALESQFLQGWLMQDRFMLRGALGAPYEFLWANPYQPGLSYYHFPLLFHAATAGDLFARSSWDDDARWFGLVNGEMQYFENGKITVLDPQQQTAPLQLGDAVVALAKGRSEFVDRQARRGTLLLLGLKPKGRYELKISGQDRRAVSADPAGTLEIEVSEPAKISVRLEE